MSRGTLNNYNSYRSSHQTLSQSQISRPPSRPPSELLCDLHVYKVPSELWRENFNNILNNVVTETVSVGIIRVPMELRLAEIREEMVNQLQLDDLLPRDYVFLRSVGRSLTRLVSKQEYQLKAKHFIPPVAYAPELYILETTQEMRDAMASDRSSQSPPISRRTSPSHRGYNGTYRVNYPGDSDNERSNKSQRTPSSPVQKYHPLPKISPTKNKDILGFGRNSSSQPKPIPLEDLEDFLHNVGSSPHRHHNDKPAAQAQIYHEQSWSEWDDPALKKPTTQDQKASHPTHQGHPLMTKRDSDDRDDNDSNVADDEDYKRKSREDHDNRLRKTQDLQRKLDEDKFLSDDETDAERRRRLEDLQLGYDDDKMRWQMDQEDRKKQALIDKRREEEERRLKELENQRKEEFERQQRQEKDRKRIEEERRQKEREERERRRKDEEEAEENRRMEEEEQRSREEADRRRKEEEKRRKEEEKQREEEKRKVEERRREEEEKRRKEEEKKKAEERRREEEEKIKEMKRITEEERKREEERRKEKEEWERKLREDLARKEELARKEDQQREKETNPSTPPVRDTESAKQRRRNEKNQLLKDVEEARQARQDQEKEREELVKRAKQMQHKTTNRRNEARDMWKKKYFEEKKKTAPLEENSSRLQQELEALHKKLMNTLEGPKEKNSKLVDSQPSPKSNYIIQCTRLQHEIEDLQRRVENARMKLTAEMKLRNQAQGELRALRAELNQRKLSLERSRQQQLAALNPALGEIGRENSHQKHSLETKSEYPKFSLEGF